MAHTVFDSLGLTSSEAKVYETLLEFKTASIGEIASYAKIHRRNVYDVVQRLLNKGLVFQVLPKKNLVYQPVHPEKLRELLDYQAQELERLLPAMVRRFNDRHIPQASYVYRGVGGLKNFIGLMLEERKTIYGIGSKGIWFDPRIENFVLHASKKYRGLRLKSYLIYDHEMRKRPEVLEIIGKPHKFLPKKYSGQSSVSIFGDYVAVYSGMTAKKFGEDISIFILKDKSLAKDYKKWWQFMWDMLPEE